MKRTLLVLTALFLLAFSANAQNSPTEQTLLGSDISIGAFAGPGVYYTDYMGEATALMGGQVAVNVNRTYYFGLSGYAFGRHPDAGPVMVDNNLRQSRFEGAYGGVMLGGMLYQDQLIHGSADVMIGGGAISRVLNHPGLHEWGDGDQGYEYDNDGFFVVQPMAHAELNMVRWMKVDLGAGYRFVSGIDQFGLENSDVSGPVAGLGLRFGKF